MSEGFSGHTNNAKLLNCSGINTTRFFSNLSDIELNNSAELDLSYDHMYASNTENNEDGVITSDNSCQTAESEVKFLKDWLILHLDLIQQQNDEILNKDKTILILQRENEMLKERIRCMEQGTPFIINNHFNTPTSPQYTETSCTEDMTQDSGPCQEDNKGNIELLDLNYLNGDNCTVDFVSVKLESNSIISENIQTNSDATILNEHHVNEPLDIQSEVTVLNDNSDIITETVVECSKVPESNCFSLNDSSEFDPMRSLRMSIRRKRLCSNSSALSGNECSTEEKRPYRRFKKKRKRVLKDSQVLTTQDHYVTLSNETNLGISSDTDLPLPHNKTLEVPRWRVKVYASCYSMEGTENLDDEVYNKRHNRLEIDERRRKRWDVQRIREQRVIEKLKRRHEPGASGSKEDQSDPLLSLWPKLEDIKFLEVCDQLPISAFGCPIPKFTPSEFSLPWINNPSVLTRRVPVRRSMGRRKNVKR